MSLTMQHLENCFNTAKQEQCKYVGVLVKLPNTPSPELIVNTRDSFDAKLDYYKKTYGTDLKHNNVEGLQIIAFTQADLLGEFEGLV